ncbi:transporter substrate-binding domain-containing protein [Microvirga brassicacearum]|uniref:Transporter substrate-binding domain-containing protein n=2 Tax=Microvirga brassicacearum TaxID=2580413 RepID=A0A5N3P5I9_9HYPH|nr:transporter substrate-binding domain-containing protein [Microvirga brassicacearum]
MKGLRCWPELLLCLMLAFGPGAALPAGAQDAAPKPAPIRIAVEGAYPPFNFIDQNNELQGFEVDLAKALCEQMAAECTLVQHEWDGIVKGLLNREYDAIMSSLEILERRQKRLAFSEPYYRIPAIFIAPKDSEIKALTPEGLAGLKIGATIRSDHADYLEQHYRESEIALYGSPVEATLDLLVGRIDAVFGDKRTLLKFLESREGECCRILGTAPDEPAYSRQFYGIGLRKEDADLKRRFDNALSALQADGTYDRIRAKYFSFDIK